MTAPASRLDAALARLRGRRIHVLGPSGTEGSTVIDFLVRHGLSGITAHDLNPADRFAGTLARTHRWLDDAGRAALLDRLRAAPVIWRQGARYLEGLDDAEVVFTPQSWFRHPENAPVREAARRGALLSSMTQLFFETWPGPTLGVTGTNGKFTVVTLIGAMLDAAGIRSVTTGNDRTHVPALLALDRATPETWLLMEISNRQLVGLPYSPHVAVVTNLAPHHLDDHGTFDAYVEAKRTIVRYQRDGDVAVLNAGDPLVAGFASATPAEIRWFDRSGPVGLGAHIRDGQIMTAGGGAAPVTSTRDLLVPGAHMIENALAAVAAAAAVGVPPGAMRGVLRAFRGLPYRFRLVVEREGVAFYEDSLGTNPTSAAAAIGSMTRPYHLIAGGLRKGARPEDFAPMLRAMAATPVRAVYLIGATAPVLDEAIAGMVRRPDVVRAGTLDAAVAAAWDAAATGEAVLLSPGCESFDQFADYRERGDRFIALIDQLPARAGGGARR
jgi:UDP-N-acetylmuramoylalanine--D-glutamate ligase